MSLPMPRLSLQEDRVLRQIIVWDDEYLRKVAKTSEPWLVEPPTTQRCAKHFKYKKHAEMMKLLGVLARSGYITKRERISAGPSGYGYDGAHVFACEPNQEGA